MDENITLDAQTADPWDSIDLSDIEEAAPGADQPEAEAESNENTEAEAVETPAEAEVQPEPAQPETFELKHLDNVQTVSRDEVIALAQKGLDYDRKFAKYEELKQFRDTNREAVEMLEDIAKVANIPLTQFISELRLRQLMNSGMSEQAARQQISLDDRERALKRREAEREKQETDAREKAEKEEQAKKKADDGRRADIQRFMQTFPNVQPDSIPKEVWENVQKNKIGLTEAYALYDRQRLASELEAEKQNAKNRQLSTGSRDTAGQNSQMDEFAKLWYAED